jgi:hypothetical protein
MDRALTAAGIRPENWSMHSDMLNRLRELVASSNVIVPSWLEDLVVHGPRYELWPTAISYCPNRVALTEFLGRWLKAAGVPQDRALDWLLEYCRQVLAQFSKTGPSGIRHGTKANTRWVYKSALSFDFDAIARHELAPDWTGKPAYMHVFHRWRELLPEEKAKELERYRQNYRPPERILPVKVRHSERFEQGMKFAREKRAAGEDLEKIRVQLNEAGYPTRTGRKWSNSTLDRELRRDHSPASSP